MPLRPSKRQPQPPPTFFLKSIVSRDNTTIYIAHFAGRINANDRKMAKPMKVFVLWDTQGTRIIYK